MNTCSDMSVCDYGNITVVMTMEGLIIIRQVLQHQERGVSATDYSI